MAPRVLTFTVLMMLCVTHVNSQSSDIQRFRTTYGALTSISCAFSDASGMKGMVKASKGGRYSITAGHMKIVCDGRTVWSSNAADKTVVISSYDASSEDVSLERVFFSILGVYDVRVHSKTKAEIKFILEPRQNGAVIAGVTRATVDVNVSDFAIKSVTVTENGQTTTWALSNVRTNGKIRASAFVYKPAKGWNVVDLR